ncbi:MAG: phytoene desaturase [Pseudomonadota bacterium]
MTEARQNAGETAVVIGAGMGGLAAAIRLAAAGLAVTLIEAQDGPGGKARCLPSLAGPVDAGPTVLTLRGTFDALFALNGERMEDHLRLIPQPVLARHWWPDGGRLDLMPDRGANIDAITAFAGTREGAAFARFDALARDLFAAFEAPMMQAARPDKATVARIALRQPRLWPALIPGVSLTRLLRSQFRDPRLVQLFGRYATYVGGRPDQSPAVLALIWQAEAQGVWAVAGGMRALAQGLADLAERMGVVIQYGSRATRIRRQNSHVTGVELAGERPLPCSICVFNGDPAALAAGMLGNAAQEAVAADVGQPRSLSALVWAFAAQSGGVLADDLIHHNVFFSEAPKAEFGPIGAGRMPEAPTLYLCAQDRAEAAPQTGAERFEIILNAPAGLPPHPEDTARCRSRTFDRLTRFGLTFDPEPGAESLTTPAMLARLFPGSQGAIYGRSPEAALAAFRRPLARTGLPGLYLAGGGAHPGAGVPMAALSGRHAAEAIIADRTSGSRSARTAMPGGMSMVSRMTERARFR